MGIILRFVFSPELLTKMILFDSDEPEGFSHVEAVTTNGHYLGAHTEGVAERPMDWDTGKFTRETFLALPATDEQTAKWLHYLRSCLGEAYGYAAIFGFITHFDLNEHHTTICSGLQTLALRWCEYFPRPLTIPAHRISVRDLHLGLMMRPDIQEVTKTDPIFLAHIAAGANVG
jgi:hypothetical protein